MMIDLKKTLLKKLKNGNIAHFYILETNEKSENNADFIKQWVLDFLDLFVKETKNSDRDFKVHIETNGIPDILFIRQNDEENKHYEVDDFGQFFAFLSFAKFDLKHRFIVIENGDTLSEIIANKLLKSLEEPSPDTTIFLINGNSKNLLQTIRSRAITLRISRSNEKIDKIEMNKQPLREWLEQIRSKHDIVSHLIKLADGELNLLDVVDYVRETRTEKLLINLLIDRVISIGNSYRTRAEVVEYLKWNDESQTFHNSEQERILSALNILTNERSTVDINYNKKDHGLI